MKRSFIISMGITIVMAIIAVWFVVTTKGDIPIHWGMSGEVNGYGSPLTMIIFPITSLLIVLLLYFIPRLDPKANNIKASGPILQVMMILLSVLMLGIEIIIIMAVNGSNIFNINIFISLLLAVLFVAMGYYLPTVKHNYMIGIRTPWTLYSENVWVKTHKMSKNWLIAVGVVFVISMLLKMPYSLIIPLVFMAIVMIGIVVYSYIAFAEEKKMNK